MKKSIKLFLIFTVLLTLSALAQQRQLKHEDGDPVTERRVALVIGNSAYTVGPLKNPVNDASAMAKALRELGFDVIHKEDLKQSEMKRAIREFGAKIRRGGVGLFYYAGHGVEVRGVNYLVPVDATPESAEEVEYEAINAGFVLAQMESAGNGMNIMILDACRANPFARSFRSTSKGLAEMVAPTGTVIAYATAPGSVASDGGNTGNGLYTQELLRFMRTPGLTIEEVFKRVRIAVSNRTKGKQIPWESTSLMGDFYFRKGGRNSAGPVISADAGDAETERWESIKDSSDPKDFERYLQEYPSGKYADSAREHIQSLSSQAASKLAPLNAGPTPTTTPSASGAIRFDGVYRSINGENISWLRFYKDSKGTWGSAIGHPVTVVKAVTQANAPEEVTRWLEQKVSKGHSLLTQDSYRGTFYTELNSNKFYIEYQGDYPLVLGTRSIEEAIDEQLKNRKRVDGTILDNTRLLLNDQNAVYEFVKVELQPVGSGVSGNAGVGASGLSEPVLKGFKIIIDSSGTRQQLVPKIAERLRSLGAEVEVNFEVSARRKYKTIGYKNGQKDAARRIARLIKDLVDVDFSQQAQSESMESNKFYIMLYN